MADKYDLVFGGVKFVDSQVWERYETADSYGKKHYVVKFSNGIEIAYVDAVKDAYVDMNIFAAIMGAQPYNDVSIYGINGFEFKSANIRNFIRIANCTILGIDLIGSSESDLCHKLAITNSASIIGNRVLTEPNNERAVIVAKQTDDVRLGFGADTRMKIKKV